MTDANIDALPPLQLPASALTAQAPLPHPDSEEFARDDKFRTAQELAPVRARGVNDLGLRDDEVGSYPWEQTARDPPICRGMTRRRPPQSITTVGTPPQTRAERKRCGAIAAFWTRNVSVTIDEGAHRDHLALERTFLSYLRTSLALVMTGVLTAQLFRLQHAASPNPRIGFFVLGAPLAAAFMGLGIVVLVVGAVRFWRQQGALVRGMVWAGGWEVVLVMGGSLAVCAVTFGMVVWVDVNKTYG